MWGSASVLIIIGAGAVILVAVGAVALRDWRIAPPPSLVGRVALAAFGALLLVTGVLLEFRSNANPASPSITSPAPTSSSVAGPPPVTRPPVTTTTSSNPEPPAGPTSQPAPSRPCSSQQTAPVRDGVIEGLTSPEGYDLDCGARNAPEEVPGLDLSGRRVEPVVDSLASWVGGELTRLSGPGPYDRSACIAQPRSAWAKNVAGINKSGAAICVRTDEGNIAVITITRAWTRQQPELSFTYRIWYN